MTAGIGVVIPYYADQVGLDRLLAALELQTVGGGAFEVVVADDGSPTPPRPGSRPYLVRTVRQDDLGFRAAAARNLGAATTTAGQLVFLDGDTIPEPGFLAAVAEAGPAAMRVGRRRHADLTGWSAADIQAWFRGERPAPLELAEPRWLRDGYASTDNLRAAGDDDYRFVISAVLAVPRREFTALGGFDATFTGYGGEDWDLAYRWRLAGGTFLHVPEAVAWHDGGDFAARGDGLARRRIKDVETLRLAGGITVPGARDPRLVWDTPDIAIEADAGGLSPAQVLAMVAPLLTGVDAAVYLRGADPLLRALPDPRIRHLAPGEPVPPGARFAVTVRQPGVLAGTSVGEIAARTMWDDADLPTPSSITPLLVRHVPTGRAWTPPLPATTWGPLPEPHTGVEELWRSRRSRDDAPASWV